MTEIEFSNGTILSVLNKRLTLIQRDNLFGLHLDEKKTLVFKRENETDFEIFNDNRLELFFQDKINKIIEGREKEMEIDLRNLKSN